MKNFTVRQARQLRGLTQDQLSKACGLDQTTISDLETGRNSNPTLKTVRRLAIALKLKPIQLRFIEPVDTKRDGAAA